MNPISIMWGSSTSGGGGGGGGGYTNPTPTPSPTPTPTNQGGIPTPIMPNIPEEASSNPLTWAGIILIALVISLTLVSRKQSARKIQRRHNSPIVGKNNPKKHSQSFMGNNGKKKKSERLL